MHVFTEYLNLLLLYALITLFLINVKSKNANQLNRPIIDDILNVEFVLENTNLKPDSV